MERRLIVEVDSRSFDGFGDAPERTEHRRAWLTALGWVVLPAARRGGLGAAGADDVAHLGHPTVTSTLCQPLAPSGTGGASSDVCTSPSAVVARTCRR